MRLLYRLDGIVNAPELSAAREGSVTVKQGARDKILMAAETLARDVGPGNLSLDAVAGRAGVSKGGLLYHFPSKSKLLEALVERHLSAFEAALDAREKLHDGRPDSLVAAYVELFVAEQCLPPPTGVLAALVENPELLAPLQRFKRLALDRLKANATDENRAVTIFLALEGMSLLRLLGIDLLSPSEFDAVCRSLSGTEGEKSC